MNVADSERSANVLKEEKEGERKAFEVPKKSNRVYISKTRRDFHREYQMSIYTVYANIFEPFFIVYKGL